MSSHTIHNHKPRGGGFTLIELLTVISIIGLLSSIILAGLNSAKKKAQDAAIISNLRNFISQVELSRLNEGDYHLVNNTLADTMKAGIQKANGTSTCFSAAAPAPYLTPSDPTLAGESNLRWACSATNSDKSILWSVSSESNRVVTWDNSNVTPDGTNKTWSQAISHCANGGKRIPNIEELYTATNVVGVTLTAGFASNFYWSSTPYTQLASRAWYVYTDLGGSVAWSAIGNPRYVRCVR